MGGSKKGNEIIPTLILDIQIDTLMYAEWHFERNQIF